MSKPRTPEQIEARRKYHREWRKKWLSNKSNAERARVAAKKHYDKNAEAKRKKSREWYYENKDHVLARLRVDQLKKRYGLTPEQYEELGTECAICGRTADVRTQKATKQAFRLAVDHCHDTGKIRGLLCGHCNSGIGMFNHDVAVLKKAIAYLRKKR